VGKSTLLSKLDNCLVLDTEQGHEPLSSLYVPVRSTRDFDETVDAVIAKGAELKGQYPYKYIALDTIDALEEFAEKTATAKYKDSTKGKKFEGTTVLELDYGLGYYFLREETMNRLVRLSRVCEHLIVVSHIRVKSLDKGGVAVEVNDISLTGKLSQMVCNLADAIGYVYRDPKNPANLMVSFAAPNDSTTMGSRYSYLAGKRFTADWELIYNPEAHKTV
jgi:hypothetical protein